LKLWNEWQPDFFIDCHVTDGADFQYNITYEYARHQEIAPSLSDWMEKHFEQDVIPEVDKAGNLASPYLQFANSAEPEKGIYTFIASPRFATGYSALRNRNGLLIEMHSVKPYKNRVLGTYDMLRYTIEEVGKNKKTLFASNTAADKERYPEITDNGKRVIPLKLGYDKKPISFAFKGFEIKIVDSKISGGKKTIFTSTPRELKIPWYDQTVVTQEVTVPEAYLVPRQWTEVIQKLDAHGIKYTRLKTPEKFTVERYRINDPKWASAPFEGRLTMTFKTATYTEEREYPEGTVMVPMSTQNAYVAIHLLEPNAPDSLLYWGFFNAIFEQKEYSEGYIMESIAEDLLKNDAKLREEYEKKLAEDQEFAGSPRARLRYLYDRSPYRDRNIGLYPVARVVNP
ncbi:MAG: peptidase M14, partial [Pyrinomonadaceae bacterium]